MTTMQHPVPEDFFGDYPDLTAEEVDEYANLAKSWVDGLLEAENSTEVIGSLPFCFAQ